MILIGLDMQIKFQYQLSYIGTFVLIVKFFYCFVI
jgi:hypothetical protein